MEPSGYGHGRLLDTLFGLAIAWGSIKASVELFERTDVRDPVDICIWCVLKEHIKNVEDLSPSINPLQVACWKGNEDIFESPLAADAGACVMVWGSDSPLVRVAFGKLLFYIALNGSKEMLDLLIGHGFDVEAATEVTVPEVQELLLDEGSCDIMEDKTGFDGDTLLKNILIACEGHYITLENVAQWSDNKEVLD